MLGFGIIAPILPVYSKDLGATGLWLGIIFAGFSISRTFFMPIFGRMSDKRGKKRFITLGLGMYSIISISYIFAFDVYSLTAIRIVHGLASAMVIPIARASVGESAAEGEEGRQMSSINTSIFLGIAFGPLIGGILNDSLGIESLFLAMSGLSVFALFISLLFLPNKMNEKIQKQSIPYRIAFRSHMIRGLFLLRIIRAINLGVLYVFLPLYAVVVNLSGIEIGILLSTTVFLNAILQKPFGYISDKVDRLPMVIFGLLLSSIPLFFIPSSNIFNELVSIVVLIGVGRAVVMSASTAMSVQVGRKMGMGFVMGLLNSGMGIGMITASLISGILFDALGIMVPFYFAGILSLIVAPIIYIQINNTNKN
jgi:MFS family permease